MATSKQQRDNMIGTAPIPSCPVCKDSMSNPIFQCKSGHSLCHNCTKSLLLPLCPLCRQDMTQMRNWQLEELVNQAKVNCPNKSRGCVYIVEASKLSDHLNECIFRTMVCPLSVFGKCSWNGNICNLEDHFNERHSSNLVKTDTDVTLPVNFNEDDRWVYLIAENKFKFLLTVKLDTQSQLAYWAIQHFGTKKTAQQHTYEIHLVSQQDARRKIVFSDYCFNDSMKTDELFRMKKCPLIHLGVLAHFAKNQKLTFKFTITRRQDKPDNKPKPDNKGKKPDDDHKMDKKPQFKKSFKPKNTKAA